MELFNFQKNALGALLKHDKCLLALDMGLGKTITSLHWVKNKAKSNWLCIVSANKLNDWYNEAMRVLDTDYYNIKVLKTAKDLNTVILKKDFENNNCFYILSYQIFSLYAKKNRLWYLKFNVNYSLLLDECQCLKNAKSLISKSILEYNRLCGQTILLSGDPISKKYENLFTILKVLELKHDKYSYSEFINDYCYFRYLIGSCVKLIIGYKNLDSLINLLHSKSYFLKTSEAYDLPEQTFIDVKIKNTKHYNNLMATDYLKINGKEFLADTTLKKINYLRQVCSGFIYDDLHKSITLNDNKLSELEMILESQNNIIIFYNFKAECEHIKNLCEKVNKRILYINGDQNTFDLEKENINNKNDNYVCLIQYMSGATGIDSLQLYFNYIVYYSPPMSGELYKQSLKRIHRLKQDNKCVYYRFIVENSVEEDIYSSLYKSENYTKELFDKKYRKIEV